MATLFPPPRSEPLRLQPRTSASLYASPEVPAASRLWRLLTLWHLASLDAPTVAIVWALAFAWAAHGRLPARLSIVLVLSAWCIYVGDRLLDANSASAPLRARHHFHWKHRRIFVPIALGAAITAVVVAVRIVHTMPGAARERDSILAAAALVYLTSVHSPRHLRDVKNRLRLPKELFVGILFTLACAAPAWAGIKGTGENGNRFGRAILLLCFAALAWLNCHAIDRWERWESAAKEQSASVRRAAVALAAVTVFAATIAAALQDSRTAALLVTTALSAALLALLDQCRQSLTPIVLRTAADLVLLTPVLLAPALLVVLP